MKILVLAKRFTSGKDSVKDNFGRILRLFEEVAKKHEVTIIEADHLRKEKFDIRIRNIKVKVAPFSPLRIIEFYNSVKKEAIEGKYDLIYAGTHPIFGGIGLLLAKLHRIKFGYDLQDNYDAYTKNPLLRFISKQATARANFVSCASFKLAEQAKAYNRNTVVIPNGFDPETAKPMDKNACRKKLKLPIKAKIVSYTGSIEFRDLDMLVNAFPKLQKIHKGIYLLLVGSSIKKKYVRIKNDRIIMLDSMPHEKLFVAINAADAMVIPYPRNSFTKVMLAPYKLVDYMACRKPIVISDAGEMQKLAPQFVFRTNNEKDMIEKIGEALKHDKVSYGKKLEELTWQKLGKKLADSMSNITP